MRAADQPSLAGQNVSSAKTMPSSISSGWSSETSRLKIGFSQIDEPDAVAELQRERRLLVGEAELLAPSARPRRPRRSSRPGGSASIAASR